MAVASQKFTPKLPYNPDISQPIIEIFNRCFNFSPSQRPLCHEILEVLDQK
jgi:hypothetical protein